MKWNMEENFSMEWNMEENFSTEWNTEWKIFSMEWKWNGRKLPVWNMEKSSSIPCPDYHNDICISLYFCTATYICFCLVGQIDYNASILLFLII